MMSKNDVSKDLVNYIKSEIFPIYDRFYAHGMLHIDSVINNSFIIASDYDVNPNMVYCVACYHDLGLAKVGKNRALHSKFSGEILVNDSNLKRFFDDKQLEIMKRAVEDHQGSRNQEPRNIYGKIVSDADRDTDVSILAKRQLQTSIKYYPELKTFDEHFARCYKYILERNKKKFNLWSNNAVINKRMNEFKECFLDQECTKKVYKEAWDDIENRNLKEKFVNYYLD